MTAYTLIDSLTAARVRIRLIRVGYRCSRIGLCIYTDAPAARVAAL